VVHRASLRSAASALVLAVLLGAGCGDPEAPESAAEPAPAPAAASESGADALAVRAAVASYVSRTPEEIEWDAPLASYGLNGLDASDVLLAVEADLNLVIRNQDLEALVGSADVNALHESLTPRTIVRLVEMARAQAAR